MTEPHNILYYGIYKLYSKNSVLSNILDNNLPIKHFYNKYFSFLENPNNKDFSKKILSDFYKENFYYDIKKAKINKHLKTNMVLKNCFLNHKILKHFIESIKYHRVFNHYVLDIKLKFGIEFLKLRIIHIGKLKEWIFLNNVIDYEKLFIGGRYIEDNKLTIVIVNSFIQPEALEWLKKRVFYVKVLNYSLDYEGLSKKKKESWYRSYLMEWKKLYEMNKRKYKKMGIRKIPNKPPLIVNHSYFENICFSVICFIIGILLKEIRKNNKRLDFLLKELNKKEYEYEYSKNNNLDKLRWLKFKEIKLIEEAIYYLKIGDFNNLNEIWISIFKGKPPPIYY